MELSKNKPTDEVIHQFFQDTDETGRFMVRSGTTGVCYFVEPIGDGRGGDWGSFNPSTGNIENKKGHDKYTGSVLVSDSILTDENGFTELDLLEVGVSPMSEIAYRDMVHYQNGVRPKNNNNGK